MRVFVTGAAGFVGRAVVKELLAHGHQVLGLARSDASAEAVRNAGAEPHRGDIEDLDSLARGARAVDGVIHLAFINDLANLERGVAADRAAIEAIGKAMVGTGKPLVVASGTLILQTGNPATEETPTGDISKNPRAKRAESEQLVRALSKSGSIRGSVIRLSPTTHGREDWAFMPILIDLARKNGYAAYVGDGSARWAAAHRLDTAVLFRLALEKGAAGAIYHAVAEEGVPTKDFISVIGKKLGVPVKSLSLEEATGSLGVAARILGTDAPVSSQWTQRELGWRPTQIGLVEDLEKNYFE